MEDKLKFRQLYDNDAYLSAFDFMNQGVVSLIVERVEKPKPTDTLAGRKIDKPIVYFKGVEKGWVAPKSKLMQAILKYAPGAKTPAELVGKTIKLKCDMNAKNPAYPGGKGPAIVVD